MARNRKRCDCIHTQSEADSHTLFLQIYSNGSARAFASVSKYHHHRLQETCEAIGKLSDARRKYSIAGTTAHHYNEWQKGFDIAGNAL